MLLQALILAIGSSIDNFAVGLSLGLTGLPCKIVVNTIIAFSNALGACIASAGGLFISGSSSSSLGSFMAACIFAHLSKEEYLSFLRKEPTSPLVKLASSSEGENNTALILNLAIPMTLNNLAGGVAGGLQGITPSEAFGCAFGVSFVFMMSGHFLGARIRSSSLGKKDNKNEEGGEGCSSASMYLDPRIGAAMIFGGLSLMQLIEIII